MIKSLRGVPGVLPERFAEAVKAVRHRPLRAHRPGRRADQLPLGCL